MKISGIITAFTLGDTCFYYCFQGIDKSLNSGKLGVGPTGDLLEIFQITRLAPNSGSSCLSPGCCDCPGELRAGGSTLSLDCRLVCSWSAILVTGCSHVNGLVVITEIPVQKQIFRVLLQTLHKSLKLAPQSAFCLECGSDDGLGYPESTFISAYLYRQPCQILGRLPRVPRLWMPDV